MQPQPPNDPDYIDYDSAESAESEPEEEEEDVFEGSTAGNEPAADRENTEHSNTNSYSWCVLRLTVVQVVQLQLRDFLSTAGIELQGTSVNNFFITFVT